MRYEITIKEVGREKPLKTSHNGLLSKKDVIAFFGLNDPDVEWYTIEEIEETEE